MCSNMCARPVLPMGSCTEPASTCVKNENTGASGRSQMMMVRPLESFLTVVRFSKEARSWLKASEQNTKQMMIVCIEVKRDFILPPRRTLKIDVTWRRGELSNCRLSNRSGGATVVLAATELRPSPHELRLSYTSSCNRLPNSAGILGHHGLSGLASKSLLECGRVLHRPIHAPAPRGMRVGQHALPRLLIGDVLAP